LSETPEKREPVDVLMVGAMLALTLHEIAAALDRLADLLTTPPEEKQ